MASIRLAQLKAPSEPKTAVAYSTSNRRVAASDAPARRLRSRRLAHLSRTPPAFRFPSPCPCSTSNTPPSSASQWLVKETDTDEELLSFLQLVLQGHLEPSFGAMFTEDLSEYVKSRMMQKLEADVEGLKEKFHRTDGKHPEAICLIAKEEGSGNVVAGCEVSVSERWSGICPVGVPAAEKDGFYVQNLIVQPGLRRQGLAQLVMNNLLETIKRMKGTAVYVHVEVQNEAAMAFYKKQKFQTVREEKPPNPEARLGITHLTLTTPSSFRDGVCVGKLLLLKLELSSVV